MTSFFNVNYFDLVDSPNNSAHWWHSMPLPNGNRIKGCSNSDCDSQLDLWKALEITDLSNQSVLDIGANDGFFSLAASFAGARDIVSVDCDWETWPNNIHYASEAWGVGLDIITADFRDYDFKRTFDTIFFLGVLYHVEDVFNCIQKLKSLLHEGGAVYLETQISSIENDNPLFELASDHFSTTVSQGKDGLSYVGISNISFTKCNSCL